MGSPVSVVLAELVMQHIEQKMVIDAPCTPKIWRRYVDDVIAILPKDKVESYLNHINSLDPNIQFTIEKEVENCLPFLDLKIMKKLNGELQFTVYRKETHTDSYLKFQS